MKQYTDELWEMEMKMRAENDEEKSRYNRNAARVREYDDNAIFIDDTPKRKKKKVKKNSLYGERKQEAELKPLQKDPFSKEGILDSMSRSKNILTEEELDISPESVIAEETVRRSGDDNSYFKEEEEVQVPSPLKKEADVKENSACLYIDYNEKLNRIILSDSIAPYSLNLNMLYDEFDEEAVKKALETDDEGMTAMNWITILYLGMIATRHPFAIYTKEEFYENFKNVTDYNRDKFFFISDGENNVLCYNVSNLSLENLRKIEKEADDESLIHLYITMFAVGNTVANAFLYEDKDYIAEYKENFTDPVSFKMAFLNDSKTVISRSLDLDIPEVFSVLDVLPQKDCITTANRLKDELSIEEEDYGEEEENIVIPPIPSTPSGVYSEEEVSSEADDDAEEELVSDATAEVIVKPQMSVPSESVSSPGEISYKKEDTVEEVEEPKEEEIVVEDYDPSEPIDDIDISSLRKKMNSSAIQIKEEESVVKKEVIKETSTDDFDLDTPIKPFC